MKNLNQNILNLIMKIILKMKIFIYQNVINIY